MTSRTLIPACFLAAALLANSTQAQDLQGTTYTGEAYTFDSVTGESSILALTGFTRFVGQARASNGTMLAIARQSSSGPDVLITIASNGVGTLIAPINPPTQFISLALDVTSGELFGLASNGLYKIDQASATVVFVGPTGLALPYAATCLPSGQLYVWESVIGSTRGMHEVDRGTGSTSQLSTGAPVINWLSSDPNGRIFGGASGGPLFEYETSGDLRLAGSVPDVDFRGVSFISPVSKFRQSCFGNQRIPSSCMSCPCGNPAPGYTIGGCLHSEGNSARLLPMGSMSVIAADLRFEVLNAKSNSFSLLLSGSNIAPANASNPCFGLETGVESSAFDGMRCVVQDVQRHGARPSDASGHIGISTNGWGPPDGPGGGIAAHGGFISGQTRHFQVLYRDLPHGTCTAEANTTQAITVTFEP